MSKQTPLKTIEAKPLAVPPDVAPSSEVGQMMRVAVENRDVAMIDKLLEVYERGLARRSEEAFNAALAKFQETCPTVLCNRSRDTTTSKGSPFKGAYADIYQLFGELKGPLCKQGLSFSFDTETGSKGEMIALGILKHVDGHKEVYRIPAPVRQPTNQTDMAQMIHGAMTTAGRTLMRMMFAIKIEDPTPDEIDAANVITEDQARQMNDMIVAIGDYGQMDTGKFLAIYGVSGISALPASVFGAAMEMLSARLADRKAKADGKT